MYYNSLYMSPIEHPQEQLPGKLSVPDAEFTKALLAVQEILYKRALKLTGNEHDAVDLVQETSTDALKAWDTFTPGSSMIAWTKTIMRFNFLNDRRKKKIIPVSQTNAPDILEGIPESHAIREDEGVDFDLLDERVKAAIDALQPEWKEVLMAQVRGLTQQEIAEKLGRPIGTVQSQEFRAKAEIRRMLGPDIKLGDII